MQSLYEVLGPSKSVEETNYIDFVKKEENGLFSIIKRAIVNNLKGDDLCFYWDIHEPVQQYIEYFLNKYHYKYKIEHISYSPDMVCFLQNIKTVACVKDLLLCFYGELQQIEHFSKSKEELWQEYNKFVTNNEKWLEAKRR